MWMAAIEIHANSCFLESLYRYSEFQTLCESTLTPSSKLHTVLRLMRCFLFSPTPFPFPSPPFRISFLGSLALNSQGVWVSYSGRRGDRDIWAWRNAHSEAARQATLCEICLINTTYLTTVVNGWKNLRPTLLWCWRNALVNAVTPLIITQTERESVTVEWQYSPVDQYSTVQSSQFSPFQYSTVKCSLH